MGEYIHEISQLWFPYFSSLLIQNSIFVGLILLLLSLFKNVPARFKYLLCTIAIIKLLIPSFLSYDFQTDYLYTDFVPGIFIGKILKKVGEVSVQTSTPIVDSAVTINWIEILFLIWMAGVFISSLIFIIRFMRMALTLRFARLAEEETYARYVSNHRIRVYISKDIPMPLTIAFFPNRIFVPDQWNEWNDQCRRIVVSHEETHLRRHDNLIQILQVVAQALYFFHPFVYLMNRKMNLYREMTCDDATIFNGIKSRLEYSKCLTEIAEKAVWSPLMHHSASTLFYHRDDLSNRIQYQMMEDIMSFKLRKNSMLILAFVIIAIPFFSWYVDSGVAESSVMKRMQENTIELTINGEEDIQVNGNKLSLEKLKSVLTDLSKELDNPILYLKFDNKVTMKLVAKIQTMLRDLDLLKVKFIGDEDQGLKLQLPNTATKEQLKKIDEKNILTLLIVPDGQIRIDDLLLDCADLGKFLKENLKKNEYMIVSIQAEEDVVYKDYVSVLDEVGKSGCKRVLIHENGS